MSVSDRALPLPSHSLELRRVQVLVSAVRALAFWLAVLLPLAYLPLLVTGLESVSLALAFATLVAVNVCALVVGQPYRPN